MFRTGCGCKKKRRFPFGSLLIALGIGILIAYIIPYYALISMLGISLVILGIWFICKK